MRNKCCQKKEVHTYPEHKHIGESVINAVRPGIDKVLSEVKEHLK